MAFRGHYPPGTSFGNRIRAYTASKEAIAEQVTRTFLGPGQSAFVSDGSAPFYVAAAAYAHYEAARTAYEKDHSRERPPKTTIDTNNIAIAAELLHWAAKGETPDIALTLAPGYFNHDLYMTCGSRTLSFVRQCAERLNAVILSASSVDAKHGPTGREPSSMQIKKAALNAKVQTVWVVEYEKLAIPWDGRLPRVYNIDQQWAAAMEDPNTFIVASKMPGLTSLDDIVPKHPQTERQWYVKNRALLRMTMNRNGNERFIEVPIVAQPAAAAQVDVLPVTAGT